MARDPKVIFWDTYPRGRTGGFIRYTGTGCNPTIDFTSVGGYTTTECGIHSDGHWWSCPRSVTTLGVGDFVTALCTHWPRNLQESESTSETQRGASSSIW